MNTASPREYSAAERRHLAAVATLFSPPPDFDVATLFAEDAVWWNGLPRLRELEGSCEHRGLAQIRKILSAAGTDLRRMGIDAYDLSSVRYEDVVTLADGDFAVRQHTMHARTHGGRHYTNVYCFVFRFDTEGKISYLTEHWNTWWADRFLFDQRAPEPAKVQRS